MDDLQIYDEKEREKDVSFLKIRFGKQVVLPWKCEATETIATRYLKNG